MISNPGPENRFYVFNPLGWSRTDVADIPYTGALPVTVYDITNQQEVPVQYIEKQGRPHIRLLATDVPPTGYKVYAFRDGFPDDLNPAAAYSGGLFESNSYSLEVSNNGTILSFKDKLNGHYEYNGGQGLNAFGDGNPSLGNAVLRNPIGPVSATVTFESTSPIPHSTEITLYRDIPRVDITNTITQNPGNSTITFTYPINVGSPDIWHEEVGAVLKASLEENGGHYATQNARYDWQTANHFVHVGNEDKGMTISNLGSHFFKLGNSTIENLDEGSSDISFLATGKVAYGTLGINNQGGDSSFLFQYALQPTSGPFNQTNSMKIAMEHQHPFATGAVAGGDLYPETSFSLLHIGEPDVLLWCLKPSEEGISNGLIARVWNQSAKGTVTIDGRYPILEAMHTTHVETNLHTVPIENENIRDTIRMQEMKTYRFWFDQLPSGSSHEQVTPDAALFTVFPNPADDFISILPSNVPPGSYVVTLLNALGMLEAQTAIVVDASCGTHRLDISTIPDGIAFLHIKGRNYAQAMRILKVGY